MAKLKSLKYTKGQFAGQTLNFPLVGDVAFAQDGSIEVDGDKLEEFLKITKDSFEFGLVDEEGQVIKKTPETPEEQEEEEDREILALLEQANSIQLLTMAGELSMDPSVAALSDAMLRRSIYKVMVSQKQQAVGTKTNAKLAKDRAKSKAKRDKAKAKSEE